ncbi:MAG TPA: B12-binding domain-containing radical SAM protein, partial [Actinobacteria bacterium]|nr:B12-binding domain-containing radical SAM protein [Actinomycetota bacterium]
MPRKKVKRFNMNVSINVFNPKPFTPFQWAAQEKIDLLEKKINNILENIPQKYINISWSDIARSQIECALSRGDTRLGSVIEDAWKAGAKFDNWTDLFDRKAWRDAFEKNGIVIDFYTTRGYDTSEILPWDSIDMIVKKEFLLSQYKKALEWEPVREMDPGTRADSNEEGK